MRSMKEAMFIGRGNDEALIAWRRVLFTKPKIPIVLYFPQLIVIAARVLGPSVLTNQYLV